MTDDNQYNISLDVQFAHHERINIHEVVNAIPEKWPCQPIEIPVF